MANILKAESTPTQTAVQRGKKVQTNILEFLAIYLENELMGIPLTKVVEITKIRDIVPVPFSKSHIRGVINIRGEIMAIVSLKETLGLSETRESQRIVILETRFGKIGIIVDEIYGVIKVREDDLEPNPMVGRYSEYVKNIAQVDNGILIIIDIDKIFEDKNGFP
ncbi:MAG: chemotaxis protein CheW [Hydrogenobaculum sp.]